LPGYKGTLDGWADTQDLVLRYTKVQCLHEQRSQTFELVNYQRGVPALTLEE